MVHASIAAVTMSPKRNGGACQHCVPLYGSRSLVGGRNENRPGPPSCEALRRIPHPPVDGPRGEAPLVVGAAGRRSRPRGVERMVRTARSSVHPTMWSTDHAPRREGRASMIKGRLSGIHGRSVRPYRLLLFAGAVLMMVQLTASAAGAASSHVGFGFNASGIGGFPTGQVTLTGGGAFDVSTGFVHAGGSFSCTSPVSQGPLAGCLAGEGVRWDTEALLSQTTFK